MDLQKATQFWAWFEANNAQYLFIDDMNSDQKSEVMGNLQRELHQYCDSIYYLIGSEDKSGRTELIITAEGNLDYFENVEFLVDQAPYLKRWNYKKFKPAIGRGYKAVVQNREFDPRNTRCQLIDNETEGRVGLRMYYNDFELENKRNFAYGTYIMLDMLLGEKSATLDIARLEIVKTPENIDEMDTIYLDQIKAYLELKKLTSR